MAKRAGLPVTEQIRGPEAGQAAGSSGPAAILTLPLLVDFESDARIWVLWDAWSRLKPARRLALLREISARRDRRARKLLAAALWNERAEVALVAVEGLLLLGDARTVASLESLAAITRSGTVAAEAKAAADNLCAAPVGETEGPTVPVSEPEFWASFVDGDGAQLLMAVLSGTQGDRRLATVSLSDRRGLVDAWGSESLPEAEVEALRTAGVRGESEAEIGWVRVDGAYCRAAVETALALNRRDHRRLPGAWEFWRDSFDGPVGESMPEADDRGFPDGQLQRRLPQTASLVHFEGFRSWLILGEDLAPFLPAARQAMRQSEEREELMSQVVSACLATVIRKPQRRLWGARLRRQAVLWQRRGDRLLGELCLAAAWGLDERNGVPSEAHPLLRAMTLVSLEIALGK